MVLKVVPKVRIRLVMISSLSVVMLLAQTASAAEQQKPPARTLTLAEAVEFALANYPAVQARLEQAAVARAGVDLARTDYLPRADLLWQANRATRNNIFGSLLPQSVIPPISGPVLPSTSYKSAWGSAAGVLFSWEPFDFGVRRARVRAAQAAQDQAKGEVALTRLEVAAAAGDAFLTVLAAEQRVKAARADVDRREVFAKSVHVLVENELRPGVDASRADAELAAAKTELIQAEATEAESRAGLAAILGVAGTQIQIAPGPLLELPPSEEAPGMALSEHPLVAVAEAKVEEAGAQVRLFERSYVPRFQLQSAVSGRGSGANLDGSFASGLNGLGFERGNWAAGLTITFPLLDFASIRAHRQIEASKERAEAARRDQALQDLKGRIEKARASLEGARQVAENTPIQLRAAREAETQARARYQAGLATLVDVADAQRLLVQAESENALARLRVWRALAELAVAQGDLQPFMQVFRKKAAGGP